MPHRSDHKDVQVVLHKIHQGGINYIASVSKSFKTAESGFTFAKMAQELCRALSQGRDGCSDELIRDSLTEMREIAQNAYTDAKAATEMFDSNRREFGEVTLMRLRNKTTSVDPSRGCKDFRVEVDSQSRCPGPWFDRSERLQ